MIPAACESCGRESSLLCDGRTLEGTCDAAICQACADRIGEVNAIVCKRSGKGRGCTPLRDTVDLCPFCSARKAAKLPALARAEHDRARDPKLEACPW